MASEEPEQGAIPAEAILSEESIAAGVDALERIHGRHLADMTQEEQADARDHWRQQVEEILEAVRSLHAGPTPGGAGRAVLSFTRPGADRDHRNGALPP